MSARMELVVIGARRHGVDYSSLPESPVHSCVRHFVGLASLAFILLVPSESSAGDDPPPVEPGFAFTFSFSPEDFTITLGEDGYHRVDFRRTEGLQHPDNEEDWGRPDLPRVTRRAALDRLDAVEQLQVLLAEPDTLPGEYLPRPVQPPREAGHPPVPPDPNVYESLIPFPRSQADPVFCGSLRGVRLFEFRLNPIQFVGHTRRLIVYRTIQVRVVTTPLGPGVAQIRERRRPGQKWSRQQNEAAWIRRTVVNPGDFDRLYLSDGQHNLNTDLGAFNPTEKPSTDRSPVELILITNNSSTRGGTLPGMEDAFARLATWKVASGVPTVIRTVDWIRENYSGIDTQEQIRKFIIDAYEKWSTDFVLLGGDIDVVPARRIVTASPPNPPSDLYYAGLDGSMNADGDQWFGEGGENDQTDPFHDVWVARIPAQDSTEAATFIDKLFDYALVPGEADSLPPALYYQRTLLATGFVGEVAWPPPFLRNGFYTAESIARDALPTSTHLTRMYEFVDTTCVDNAQTCNIEDTTNNVFRGSWGPGITEWQTTAQLVDSLNGEAQGVGYAYIYHREHSNRYELGGPSHEGGIDCEDCVHETVAPLDEAAALDLTNGPQYFTLITSGSESNAFDFRSISERVLMNPVGGAIAYLGKSRSQTAASHQIPVDFFDEQFNHGAVRFGEAAAFGIDAQNSFQYAATWNAMGDPTLPLWTEPPATLDVEITPSSFPELGVNNFSVDIGVNRDNVLVCLRNDEVYASDFTDDGVQDFVINLQSADTLWVIVSGANTEPVKTFIPYSGTSSTPTVLYQDHDVTDTTSSYSNHNGVVEAGERIRVEVEVKNVGGATAGGVAGTLSAYGPLLFDLDWGPVSTYLGKDGAHPAADADSGFAFPANWFGIRPDDRPNLLAGSTGGLFVWREFDYPTRPRWHLVARGPHIVPTQLPLVGSITTVGAFSDTASWIDAGETFQLASPDSLYINLTIGNTDADSLTFRARESAWVTGVRDSVSFGPIGTLATKVDTFLVDLAVRTADQHQLIFVLNAADSTGSRVGVSEFAVPVAAPALKLHELDWKKSSIFYSLYPRVKNFGGGRADHVKATLSVGAGSATLIDKTIDFGPIEAGAIGYMGATDTLFLKTSNVSTLKLTMTIRNYFANGDSLDWVAQRIDLVRPSKPSSIELEPGFESMRVLWSVQSPPSDLLGANIFRGVSTDTTTFVRLNKDPILLTRTFEDLTNSPDTLYYYAVALQDSSGNESPLSEVRAERATMVEHENWPRRMDGGHVGSPTLVDLDGDTDLEVVMGGKEGLYAWEADGNEFVVGDDNPATNIPFIPLSEAVLFSRGLVGAPAVGDLDGDDVKEIVFTRWEDSLFVYNEEGSFEWKRMLDVNHVFGNAGPGWSSPAIGNISGDGNLEVVIGSWDGVLYAWDADGNGVLNSNGYFAGTGAGFLFQTPALADLNGQGGLEVVIGTGNLGSVKGRVLALKAQDTSPSNGEADSLWVWNSGLNRAYSTPAIGLMNDTLRVVCTSAGGASNSEIVVLNASSGIKQPHLSRDVSTPGIPLNGGNPTPPVLGDVDGDGELEIVVGGAFSDAQNPAGRNVTFNVWDPLANPATLSTLNDSIPASPMGVNNVSNGAVVGDLDGDGNVEIAYGSDTFGLFVWEYAGGFRPDRGWPATLQGEIYAHLAVGNADTADSAFELVVADRSGNVHMFDFADAGVATPAIEWSQLGNGPLHQGTHGEQGFRAKNDGEVPVGLSLGYPNPFNPTVRFQVAFQERVRARIGVYDVVGRCVKTLTDGVLDPGRHVVTWDGRNEGGQGVASGVYFLRMEARGVIDTRRIVLVR